METISSTEVSRRLGEIFARASRGESFNVTQYGRPYVQIGPPGEIPPEPVAKKAPAKKTAKRPPRKRATNVPG